MKAFQSFRLDTENQCLWREEDRVPIPPKAYDVLRYLVENPERLVTPDELLEKLWPETYVNPEVIRKYILEIRKILGDRLDKPQFIETLPKRGYRFVATVMEDNSVETSASSARHKDEGVTNVEARPDAASYEQETSYGTGVLWKFAVALAVIVAGGIVGYFGLARTRAFARPVNNPSIAVLPFADMSPAKDQEYFSDGLSEQLIQDLARVPSLKVVGRSSAFQFKGKNEDLREVGRKLSVANVLEGSVRREGNHLRITAELIKTDDGFQVWSQTYDRETKDILAVQDEIALAATEALQMKLLEGGRQTVASNLYNTNPEAYQAYLQGQYFFARGQDKRDLDTALSYADQAIKLDPNYASAWAQRSRVLRTMAGVALIENTEGFRRARESAKRAIALDSNLAAGYLAMSMVQLSYDWDWQGADLSLNRAGLLEPGSAQIVSTRAHLTRMLGDVEGAIELYKQAIALDPLRANFHLALGYELYVAGRYKEAQVALLRAQELNPELSSLHLTRAQIFLSEGRQQEALAEMEKETGEWEKLSGESLIYYALGDSKKSEDSLRKLLATHQNDCAAQIAEVYAYRGETEKAFEWLDRAYWQRDPGLPEIKADPLMTSLRHDPRFTELLKRMHLPT
jgi:TolB-like protein/DNA-binding winged helix-turn-helix (wHTH) protein/Tfp pilus assembly protein PilF